MFQIWMKHLGISRVNPGNTKRDQFDPLVFSNFLHNPLKFFEKLGNSRGFDLWSFDGRINDDVNYTRSYGENTKARSKIFIDVTIKNLLKLIFEIISHNHLLFSHITVWFYNIFKILNWNSEEKSWKFLEHFNFYQHFQFLGSTILYIFMS